MNLLMIQNNSVNNNKHGMKNTSSDVLSMASSSSSSGSSSAHEMVDDEEEDEGVATDATADNGNSNNKINTAKKDIKSAAKSRSAPHRNIRINQEDGLAKGKTTTPPSGQNAVHLKMHDCTYHLEIPTCFKAREKLIPHPPFKKWMKKGHSF